MKFRQNLFLKNGLLKTISTESCIDFVSGGSEFVFYLFGSCGFICSEVSQPCSVFGVLEDSGETCLDNFSSWIFVSCSLFSVWVGFDGLMYLLIEVFTGLYLGGIETFLPFAEVTFELFWVILLHCVHIFSNMDSHDSVSMDLGVI